MIWEFHIMHLTTFTPIPPRSASLPFDLTQRKEKKKTSNPPTPEKKEQSRQRAIEENSYTL